MPLTCQWLSQEGDLLSSRFAAAGPAQRPQPIRGAVPGADEPVLGRAQLLGVTGSWKPAWPGSPGAAGSLRPQRVPRGPSHQARSPASYCAGAFVRCCQGIESRRQRPAALHNSWPVESGKGWDCGVCPTGRSPVRKNRPPEGSRPPRQVPEPHSGHGGEPLCRPWAAVLPSAGSLLVTTSSPPALLHPAPPTFGSPCWPDLLCRTWPAQGQNAGWRKEPGEPHFQMLPGGSPSPQEPHLWPGSAGI